MTVFTVTNLNDSGAGSLRQAILDANATAGTDTIVFDAGLTGGTTAGVNDGLIVLTSGELAITDSLIIDGDVDGDNRADIVLDGNDASRVLMVSGTGVAADLQSLTLQNGYSAGAGGALYGGVGTVLSLTHLTVRDSSATQGGGIYARLAAITNSTISDNSASLGGGLYFHTENSLLSNVTVSGNTAFDAGGGIYSFGADIALYSSTVTNNMLDGGASGDASGIALANSADVGIFNTIVAANTGGTRDVIALGPASGTLIAQNSLFGTTTVVDLDGGDNLFSDTPLLETLADNGGTVQTHALTIGSLALSAGEAGILPADLADLDGDGNTAEDLPLDANGNARINDVLDIGAVEADQSHIIVTALTDTDDGDFTAGNLSLREAIALVSPAGMISFDASITGGSTSGVDDGVITLTLGELTISKDIHITGDVDADLKADITLDGNDASRVLMTYGSGTDLTLRSLDFTGGYSTGNGGAIYSTAGALSIINSTIRDSAAAFGGGVLASDLVLANVSVLNNTATSSAGGISILGGGTGVFDNVTVSGNGGGAQASGVLIGSSGNLMLRNSTVTDNSGGSFGGVTASSNSTVTSHNSIVSGNSGSSRDDFFVSSSATLIAQNSLLGTGVTPTVDDGGNIFSDTPGLDPLADNGGPVQTHALQLTSAGFSAGDATLLSLDTLDVDGDADTGEALPIDANGNARVDGAGLDIGAAEAIALADLVVDGFFVLGFSATVGQTLTYIWEVENIGVGTADPFRTAVYLSSDATVTTADTLVGFVDTPLVNLPGTSEMQAVDLAITGAIAPGTYYLAAITDDLGAVTEGNESNNTSAALQITLTGLGPVTLDTGGTLGGYATIAQALDAAGDGDMISVVPTEYLVNPETAQVANDNLTIDLAAGITPVLQMQDLPMVETLTLTGAGAALVLGNSLDNLITAGTGDDTLSGLAGADTLDGGLGTNTADYSLSDVRVEIDQAFGTADSGHATGDVLINVQNLIGSDFNDLLRGSNDANRLDGGAGGDNINGRGGDDLVLGGLGNDLLSGGNNDDTLFGGADNDQIFGNGGIDQIFGEQGLDTIFGGGGDDSIEAGAEDDEVSGQGGADTILGEGGEDILRGGSGNDSLLGGDQDDQLFGNGNNDTLEGGAGNDVLQGAAGVDVLLGGTGNDTLTGGIGGDRLDGGTGNDVMNGGGADNVRDVFVYLLGYEQDRINAFDQLGTDQLQLDEDLWAATNPGLTAQEVIDTFGVLNGTGTILTLDFGGGDVLEVQNAGGIDQMTLGADVLIV